MADLISRRKNPLDDAANELVGLAGVQLPDNPAPRRAAYQPAFLRAPSGLPALEAPEEQSLAGKGLDAFLHSLGPKNLELLGAGIRALGTSQQIEGIHGAGHTIEKFGRELEIGKPVELPEVTNVQSALEWAFLGVSQGLGSIGAPLIGGAVGAGAGGAAAGPLGAAVGAGAGAFAVNDLILAGEAVRQFEQSGVEPYQASRAAHAIAPLMAALDTFGLIKILRGPMRGQTDSMLKYIGKRMAHGASVESVTEMSQGIIRELTDAKLSGEPKATERAKSIIEEGIIAGLTGGVVGGAAAPFGRRRRDAPPDEDTSGLPPDPEDIAVEGEWIPGERKQGAAGRRQRRGRTYQQRKRPKPALEAQKGLPPPPDTGTETTPLPALERYVEQRAERELKRYEDLTGRKTPIPTGKKTPPARRFGIDEKGQRVAASPEGDMVLKALAGKGPTPQGDQVLAALNGLQRTPQGDAMVAALSGTSPTPQGGVLLRALSGTGPTPSGDQVLAALNGLQRTPQGDALVAALSGTPPAPTGRRALAPPERGRVTPGRPRRPRFDTQRDRAAAVDRPVVEQAMADVRGGVITPAVEQLMADVRGAIKGKPTPEQAMLDVRGSVDKPVIEQAMADVRGGVVSPAVEQVMAAVQGSIRGTPPPEQAMADVRGAIKGRPTPERPGADVRGAIQGRPPPERPMADVRGAIKGPPVVEQAMADVRGGVITPAVEQVMADVRGAIKGKPPPEQAMLDVRGSVDKPVIEQAMADVRGGVVSPAVEQVMAAVQGSIRGTPPPEQAMADVRGAIKGPPVVEQAMLDVRGGVISPPVEQLMAAVRATIKSAPSPEGKLLLAALSGRGPQLDAATLGRALSGLSRTPQGRQMLRLLSGPPAPETDVDRAAAKTDTDPTDAQKEAGNYKKGTVKVQGLEIAIENPKGSERSGVDPGGQPWSVTMPAHYGYVKRTEGADGDQVDVYIGPNPHAPTVFIVNQVDADSKKFDEHKAMLGYDVEAQALTDYDAAFDDGRGPERRESVVAMPMSAFRQWLKDGDTTKPVKAATAQKATEAVGAQRIKRDVGQGVDRTDRVAMVEHEEMSVTPKGRDVPVRYGIVEMSDVVASHDAEGRPNPAYPADLQPRDRAEKVSREQVLELSSEGRFNPNLLMPSPSTDTGPPLLGRDLAVESGNGRMAVLANVYARSPDQGTAGLRYRAAVEQWADRQGMGEQARAMRNPILVRIRTDDADRRALAIESNIDTKLAPSASEQAQTDAERIGGLDVIGNQPPREIERRFVEGLTAGERGNLVLPDGTLSQAGRARLENAVLWEGWRLPRLQKRATEASTEGYKRVLNVFQKAASAAATARYHGAELDPITEGLDYYLETQDREESVDFRLSQIDAFSESPLNEDSEAVARGLDEATSEKQARAVVDAALGELRARGEQKTRGDLVGGRVERPLAGVINQALAEARGQTDLFAAPPSKPAPKPKAPPKPKPKAMVPSQTRGETYADLTPEAMQAGVTPFDAAGHQAAVDFVLGKGKESKTEYLVLLDASNGTVHAGTSNLPDAVQFTNNVGKVAKDPDSELVLYHNHPSNTALSAPDIALLAVYPGLRVIVASGHDGAFTSARLATGALEYLERIAARHQSSAYQAIRNEQRKADQVLRDTIIPLIQRKEVDSDDAVKWHNDSINRILAKLGYLEYETNVELPIEQMERIESVVQTIQAFDEQNRDASLRNRPTGSIRVSEGVVGVLGQVAQARSERPSGEGRKGARGRAPRRRGVAERAGLTPPRPLAGDSLESWNQLVALARTSATFSEFRTRAADPPPGVGSLERFYANVKGDVYERSPAGASSATRRVQAVVDRVMAGWDATRMPYVRVVPDAAALPEGIQRRLGDGIGQTRGILVRHAEQPVIYLVADRLPTADDVQRTLIHEAVGHLSMMDMMGEEFGSLLARVYRERRQPIYRGVHREVIANYPGIESDPDRLAAEMIAHMAERRMSKPIMMRVVEAVRRFLRSIGFRLALSFDEVMGLLARADRRLRERAPADPEADAQQVQVGQALDALKDVYESRVVSLTGANEAIPDTFEGIVRALNAVAFELEDLSGMGIAGLTVPEQRVGRLLERQKALRAALEKMRPKAEVIPFRGPREETPLYEARGPRKGLGRYIDPARPVESVFRVLSLPFGGLDADGNVRLSKPMIGATRKVIREWRPGPEGRFRWLDMPLEVARHGWLNRYGTPHDFVVRERQKFADQYEIMQHLAGILQGFVDIDMTATEAQALQDILEGKDFDDAKLNELAKPIRKMLDDFGEELVRLGLLSKESYLRNLGRYLHRSYREYEFGAPPIVQWGRRQMRSRKSALHGDILKRRGRRANVSLARLLKDIDNKSRGEAAKQTEWDIFDLYSGDGKVKKRVYRPKNMPDAGTTKIDQSTAGNGYWTHAGTWELRREKGGNPYLWRDYSPEEREAMGEIRDARYNLIKTFELIARDLSTGRFFQDVADNENWFRAEKPDGVVVDGSEVTRFYSTVAGIDWVRVPDTMIPKSNTKRWGALAGGYLRASLWRDLVELDKMQNPNGLDWLMRQWKINKTSRSPTVHFNNTVGNMILSELYDFTAQDMIRGLTEFATRGQVYHEAVSEGIFGSGFVLTEINNQDMAQVIQDVIKEVERAEGMGRTNMQRVFDLVARLDKKMQDAYRWEDEIFRLMSYMKDRDNGLEPAEAAQNAIDRFLNYDIRAPWPNVLRRSLLPFISYTYAFIPQWLKAMAQKPWKIAKISAIGYALIALSWEMVPGDEDEERRAMSERDKGWTWAGLPKMLRLPFKSGDDPLYIGMTRVLPGGGLAETDTNLLGLPEWAMVTGPVLMGAELAMNRVSYTGQDIVNSIADTGMEKAEKRATYLWRALMPNAPWIPGSWNYKLLERSIVGETDIFGREYSTTVALVRQFGPRIYPFDLETEMGRRAMELDREIRAQKAVIRQLQRDFARNRISKSAFDKGMKRRMDMIGRIEKKAANLAGEVE